MVVTYVQHYQYLNLNYTENLFLCLHAKIIPLRVFCKLPFK